VLAIHTQWRGIEVVAKEEKEFFEILRKGGNVVYAVLVEETRRHQYDWVGVQTTRVWLVESIPR